MLERGSIETDLVPSPVDLASLRPGSGPAAELPIVLWLHGGGGSARFLQSCQPQFTACWQEASLPDLIAVTPSAGWSGYLDLADGSERWETFLVDELIPRIRKQTGSTDGPVIVGGISSGAVAALRLGFKYPEVFRAVVALEPTLESAVDLDDIPLRDRVHLPERMRIRQFGDPVDPERWWANHPPAIVEANAAAVVANGQAIYLECGDDDQFHAQFGTEALHRQLFDASISHEYRLVRGGDHVGASLGPRVVDALRFVGKVLGRERQAPPSFEAFVEVENFTTQVRDLETAVGYRQERKVARPDCQLRVSIQGEGPTIVALPSLGRGADDFADLSRRLARVGYRVVRPEPRGVTGTSIVLDNPTLERFADDIIAVIEDLGGPVTLLGHDYGAQLAQLVAVTRPSLVSGLIVLAPPGPTPPKPEPATALRRVFIPELSDEEHLEAVALALFADGNDPVVWVDGWYPTLAFAQAEAERYLPPEELWAQIRCDTLIVQPADDRIVVPENAWLMAAELESLATVVLVPNAGHALLPEQPEVVATAILSWLGARSAR